MSPRQPRGWNKPYTLAQSIRAFCAFVEVQPSGCWYWRGAHDGHGYGHLTRKGKVIKAHRFAYELVHGPIRKRLVLDHLCRIPLCVNPAHLEAVTNKENLLRGEGWAGRHARKTTCPRGHEYDVFKLKNGGPMRECLRCRRDFANAWYAKNKGRLAKERRRKQERKIERA